MKSSLVFLTCLLLISCSSCSQTEGGNQLAGKKDITGVGGGCEGCEAIYESPLPFAQLNAVDTLPDFGGGGPRLCISGIVYQRDGRTPAKGVVIYIYHTDQRGKYPARETDTGWAKRHGTIRGWVKTGADGFYQFYTLVPASYPGTRSPKHIHPVVKEPGKNEYYIDEFLFDDDPFITRTIRNNPLPRGSNGIVKTVMKNGILYATRHIILGSNIPGYPPGETVALRSGLAVGSDCPAFDPLHLSGADKGSTACPMCKYGFGQGVMIWVNHTNLDQLKHLARQLDHQMILRGEKNFRAFLVYMNPGYDRNAKEGLSILQSKLQQWCKAEGLQKLAFVWVPSPVDKETCVVYEINPGAKNTVFLYKKRKVVAKWVDMEYNDEALHRIMQIIDSPIL